MESREVRRGGKRTPEGFLFELTGGDTALDFVNTVDMRPLPTRKELLDTYEDVCSWARQAEILTSEREAALRKRAARLPREAARARQRLLEARECLFQVLSAIVDGGELPTDVLDRWNRLAQRALARFTLERTKDGFEWRCAADPEELDFVLWHILFSAVKLATGPEVSRIRRCASESCDWMFLDRSKRGNRRWCDMTVCGNRAKARRFYLRRKRK
jgi:predicted RNA-binding Zn ribbon-like protein